MRRTTADQSLKKSRRKTSNDDQAQLMKLLGERLRCETILSRLSAAFINLPATEVDSHIDAGLQLLVEYLDIDRSSLALFSDDGQELFVTHSYTRPPIPPHPRANIAPVLPWYTSKIRQGELLRFSHLPEELPPEAVREREAYRHTSMPQSHLVIPFKVGRSILGGIGFGSFRRPYNWPDELVQTLKLAGEIFANAVARKQAEEKETRLRDQLVLAGRVSLMGELAASIAHEVNQPLCGIISNAQTIQRMLASGGFDLTELLEALADITQDGKRASDVLARIRSLLKKVPTETTTVDLNEVIREVIVLMRWELNRRRIQVKQELTDKLPYVRGDRVQLQQVILNFMINAADAMELIAPEKRVLTLRSTPDGPDGVLVAVVDTGIGIDPQHSSRLFDSFFTTKPGGMGMGLAICRTILDAHGGRIWASSNKEGGSVFQFTLPCLRENTS